MTFPAEEPAEGPTYDVCVVGAGPAGLAAAVTAASAGRRVALVDAGSQPGGQYWRQPAGPGAAGSRAGDDDHDSATYQRLCAILAGHVRREAVTYLPRHHAWALARDSDSFTIHALGQRDGVAPAEQLVVASAVILAPGAYDTQVPFDGWDLPGVYTAGAAQALLTEHGVRVGRRIVVAGTGPFLLPVAAGLAAAGATVVAVCEANSPARWARPAALWALARTPSRLLEARRYARVLARRRVPYQPGTTVVAAHGNAEVEAVTIGRPDGRRGRRLEADAVAVGWGFTPQVELPLAAGCRTRVDTDGSLVVEIDEDQEASVRGVFVAGEATGVGGAALAMVEGELAGLAVADRTGPGASERYAARMRWLRRRRTSLRAFAGAMHRAYPLPAAWTERLPDTTIVCRCEEVTVGQLREAVALGAEDARTAKLLARPGMGWCQGRVCGRATAALVAAWTGRPADPGAAERPVATPVPLDLLARGSDPDD